MQSQSAESTAPPTDETSCCISTKKYSWCMGLPLGFLTSACNKGEIPFHIIGRKYTEGPNSRTHAYNTPNVRVHRGRGMARTLTRKQGLHYLKMYIICSLVPRPPRPAFVACSTKSGGRPGRTYHVMCAAADVMFSLLTSGFVLSLSLFFP